MLVVQVRELFYYEDGHLYNRVDRSSLAKKDRRVGNLKPDGYLRVVVEGKYYVVHRLIYLYHHGYLPEFLDHIDRDRTNNRIENLRECTPAENSRNACPRRGSASNFKGVGREGDSKWRATVKMDDVNYYLGAFDTEEEAALAYNKKALELHGEFAYLNILPD